MSCPLLSVFKEAVAAAGWDFHSDRLWDLYAEWEKEQGNLNFMTGVYDQVLRVPTQLYNTHYEKYAMLIDHMLYVLSYFFSSHNSSDLRHIIHIPHTHAWICEFFLPFLLTLIFCDLFPPLYLDAAECINKSLIGKQLNTSNPDHQNIKKMILLSESIKIMMTLTLNKADVL